MFAKEEQSQAWNAQEFQSRPVGVALARPPPRFMTHTHGMNKVLFWPKLGS